MPEAFEMWSEVERKAGRILIRFVTSVRSVIILGQVYPEWILNSVLGHRKSVPFP